MPPTPLPLALATGWVDTAHWLREQCYCSIEALKGRVGSPRWMTVQSGELRTCLWGKSRVGLGGRDVADCKDVGHSEAWYQTFPIHHLIQLLTLPDTVTGTVRPGEPK